jgi:diadenosine tetraphosphate (Ap4A) HIT family hydrolase
MRDSNCIFCNIEEDKIILKNDLAFVINDKYPHSKGHILIIPVRHFENYFDITKDELTSINELLIKSRENIDSSFKPNGYNIGINVGKAAGQIIMHAHVHLIPRYK